MNVFDRLGIPMDADERQIRQAYARHLKTTRPDDDPEAFQRLHETYQQALQYCRQHASAGMHEVLDEPRIQDAPAALTGAASREGTSCAPVSPIPLQGHELTPDSACEPPHSISSYSSESSVDIGDNTLAITDITYPHFNFAAFFDEVMHRAQHTSAQALADWLGTHEDLYALRLKQTVADALFEQLGHEDILIPLPALAVLEHFFDQQNYLLTRRMTMRWAIERENTTHYGEPHPRIIRLLKRRFHWASALIIGCVPGLSGRIAHLSNRLIDDYGALPDAIDPRQHQFFQQLSRNDYLGAWRWSILLLRSLVLGVVVYLLVSMSTRPALPAAMEWAGLALAFQVIRQLTLGLHAISLGHPQRFQQPWRVLLPVGVALLGALSALMLPQAEWAYLWVLPMALLYWRRGFDALRFFLGTVFILSISTPLPSLTCGVLALALIPVGLTLFDALYARRHRIPLAAAAGNRWTRMASLVLLIWPLADRLRRLLEG